MGAGNPPTALSLDGAPVEGVEEFIYLGSKQSSSGYWFRYASQGWASQFSDEFSTADMEMQLSQHEH